MALAIPMNHALLRKTVTSDGDEQLAAPGELELVRRFVNTRDLELETEALGAPAQLDAWLREYGLAQADRAATAADLKRALALREALRALLLANATGDPPPPAALDALDAVGRQATLRPRGTPSGVELAPVASGAGAALARLLSIVVLAQAAGTWPRLKACPGERCQWALYDRTRSRTRTWCAAEKCGARTRARNYRRRLAADR
jgi:predicted RNA-binding Zn ribbon-like protein